MSSGQTIMEVKVSFSISNNMRSFPLPAQLGGSTGSLQPKTAEEEFLEYAQMTPAERMRANVLQEMNLTEDQLKSMDAETREKIENEIRERIKEKVENSAEAKTGVMVDKDA